MAFWIFKCDPKVYDLDSRLADPDPIITWNISQYRDRVRPRDIAFLWRTGKRRGIRGAMQIDEGPDEIPEFKREIDRFFDDPQSHEGQRIIRKKWRVIGTLICRDAALNMNELRTHPGLESLSAFTPVPATVFPVTDREGQIILRLVGLPAFA